MRLVVLFVLVAGCGKKAAAIADAAAAPPDAAVVVVPDAAPPLRWVYDGTRHDDEGPEASVPEKQRVELVQVGRGRHGDHHVITLEVRMDGKPVDDETVDAWSAAPFATFGSHLFLVVGPYDKQRGVWLLYGKSATPDPQDLDDALAGPPLWPLARPGRKGMDRNADDEVVVFSGLIGRWESICAGYQHPAEESGDSFAWERCFAPGVGITRLEFDSVWGSHELTLVAAPAGFALP